MDPSSCEVLELLYHDLIPDGCHLYDRLLTSQPEMYKARRRFPSRNGHTIVRRLFFASEFILIRILQLLPVSTAFLNAILLRHDNVRLMERKHWVRISHLHTSAAGTSNEVELRIDGELSAKAFEEVNKVCDSALKPLEAPNTWKTLAS